MQEAIKRLLEQMKVDTDDPNFKGTPRRVARMWQEFTNPSPVGLKDFPMIKRGGMIVLRNHEAYGFCPHHLLPVKYTFTFGYVPRGKRVAGASKPLRAFNYALSQLPLQEDIGPIVIEQMRDLEPMGMGTLVKGEHLCMRMRGVMSPCSDMVTDCMQGVFLYAQDVKQEFLTLCQI